MEASTPAQDHASETEVFNQIISQVMDIDRYTLGRNREEYLIQFAGRLTQSPEEAYQLLQVRLSPYRVTPWLREVNGLQTIILKPAPEKIETPPQRINLLLFLITFASILFAGMLTVYNGPETTDLRQIWRHAVQHLDLALAFAVSLLSILTAHEFGHYFAARYHRTRVTLPFFIPFPLSPFGTMGAFIRLLEPPRNKKVLLDIGLAGPLAGLVVTLPVLLIGLSLSSVEPLPQTFPENFMFEGNSLLYLGLKYIVHGAWLPQPASFQGMHPFVYWVRFFFTGTPLPSGGLDVTIHPVAWAGWAGLLVTSLNLIPIGQFDGGHLIYSLYGEKVRWLRPVLLVILVVLGFIWSGWWLWAFMVLLFGHRYAEPLDGITALNPARKAIARLGLILFILIFMPVPLITF